ncbi:MAG: CpsD/CapB family tyrosine-protein kinase [Desulfobacteraceae bacterium]|nr:CpsD/CapB family tyrosine-protein kinase [Desulfobacteraceae bacterium]
MINRKETEGLRNKIIEFNSEGPLCSIMITGSIPGEGCTTVSVNLAVSLASSEDVNVLLIDANSQNSDLNSFFNVSNQDGLWEILSNQVDSSKIIQKTTYPNLSFLPSGNEDTFNNKAVLEHGKYKNIFTELGSRYDYVVVDSSPMNMTSCSHFLAPLMDGVFLVVQAGKTRRQVAASAKKRLDDVSANIMGVVLNKRKYEIPNFIYNHL